MSGLRTASKLAHEAGVNVETVRDYERRGPTRQPARRAEGWRHYDDYDDAGRRIRFIERALQQGFSLDDIDLNTMRIALEDLAATCRPSRPSPSPMRVRSRVRSYIDET